MHKLQQAILSVSDRRLLEAELIVKIQSLGTFLSDLKGISDWSLSYNQQDSFGLEVREQIIEDCDQSDSSQLAIRVYIGAKSGVATCLGIQWSDWTATVLKAFDIARLSQDDRYERLPDRQCFAVRPPVLRLESAEEYTQNDLFQQAMLIERLALDGEAPGLLQSNGSSVTAHYGLNIRANSRGLWCVEPSTFYGHSLSLIAHGPKGSESEWASEHSRQWSRLSEAAYIAKLAKTRALDKMHKQNVPSGDYPIIFSPRCSYTLLKHIFAGLSGRAQYLQSTFLWNAVGQTILPSWVKIFDDPHCEWGLGSSAIDSDGLVTAPQILIEHGIVKQYILSHYSALRLGLAPSGLGSGLLNPAMTTNVKSFEELVNKYPKCLVVDSLSGTGVNINQGTYSRGVEGFYYEQGQRLFALKEVTIATSLAPLYHSLEGHAPDYEPLSAWKIGSLAFPSMRVSSS